nr:MAG TPA: hypothetical protein [Caudoviricetes sp.]
MHPYGYYLQCTTPSRPGIGRSRPGICPVVRGCGDLLRGVPCCDRSNNYLHTLMC